MAILQVSPMAAVPPRAKRVVLPATVLLKLPLLPVPTIENVRLARLAGLLASNSTRLAPSTLATKPVLAALMLAARPAASSTTGTLARTTWL